MPFKEGLYSFNNKFEMQVNSDGTIMLTPDHPTSIRLSELFNADNWSEVEEEEK